MLEGGDGAFGASGARTLLRDRERSRVADLSLVREDLSSGLRDMVKANECRQFEESWDLGDN